MKRGSLEETETILRKSSEKKQNLLSFRRTQKSNKCLKMKFVVHFNNSDFRTELQNPNRPAGQLVRSVDVYPEEAALQQHERKL